MLKKILESLEKRSNKLTENLKLVYLIALVASTIPFMIIMIYYGWDFAAFWNVGFLTVLTTIAGIVIKFLGGLGLILTYAWGCSFILKMFSKKIKGKKKEADRMKLFLVYGSLVLAIYGLYNILSSLFALPNITIITYLLTIYGIISLMLLVYIIPCFREQFQPVTAPVSTWQKIKGKFGGFKYCLWKGYQSRIRKDFGKIIATEYGKYKIELEDIRAQLSGVLLLPISIIYIGFLPLFGIAIVIWLRIFSQNKKPFMKFEKILLISLIAGLMVLSIFLFIVITDPFIMAFFNVSYGIGLIFSVCLFIITFRKV